MFQKPPPPPRPFGGPPLENDRPPRETSAAIGLLRLLLVAAIVLPLTLLAITAQLSWDARLQEAWDRTTRLDDLVYS